MVLQSIVRVFGGDPNKREIEKISLIVDEINGLEEEYEALSIEALRGKTAEFRQRLKEGETLDDLLPEAFAAVREASKRTIGLRHYDVQMIGGIVLHQGRIAEMRTGEGKTLVATLPVYLNALTSKGVHLVTVNDYLARRDARWMTPIYQTLGLTVGVLQAADRTENGRKAFIVDLERSNAREDLDQLQMVDRAEAYKCDIVYGTNSEFGFDYLRDNLTMSLEERVQRGHYFAIVDEVDNILIDEARTPLIISGPASDDTEWYVRMAQVVRQLRPEDYEVNEKDHQVSLTEVGEVHVEEIVGQTLRDPDRPEDITPEQARLLGYLEQALRAQHLYRRNKDYIVQGGKVIIVDEFTGRLMPGRRWSEGLHQAVEAKENVNIEPENVTYATITIQNYFRMYEKLGGMTGTALTEAEEFNKIYKLEVLPIPMNLEYVAEKNNSSLIFKETKDAKNYPVQYYLRRDDPDGKPVFWRRQDFPDLVYRTEEGKLRAITREIIHNYVIGRPQLVGTTSVEHSERLSLRLGAEPLRRLVQVMLVRDAWIEKNNVSPELEIKELASFNRPLNEINTNELRQFSRQAGLISINPEDSENIARTLKILELSDTDLPRLSTVLQGGIPHQVLNARKHDEESQIIARAGAFGAVTIATNMAGRGVDIKLGGELSEEVIADVIRVLESANVENPYDMTNAERRKALQGLSADQYGIYEEAVNTFLKYFTDMEKVRELGGLHVIGSERHEARRIDNQLRGRAARQGDPGSSRFYLSLEDELMRLFGGVQMENVMNRLRVDLSMPIESGLLGRMVEQAQERVEGNNFDVRKHLLEYDDVLNAQRKRIYGERDRALQKEDLHEDVVDILRVELQERIPTALKDEEGPWKLLAFLEEVQPSMSFEQEKTRVPSYSVYLVMNELKERFEKSGAKSLKEIVLDLAKETIAAENEHILSTSKIQLEKTHSSMEQVLDERLDTLDTFFEGLESGDEGENQQRRRPQEMLDELSGLVRTQLRLSSDELRRLPEADSDVKEKLADQITSGLMVLALTRVIGAFERRLDDSLEIRPAQLMELGWGEVEDTLMDALKTSLDKRLESLVSAQGQISQNLDATLAHIDESNLSEDDLVELLMNISLGNRLAIDPKTHQRVTRKVLILNYIYLAAQMIQGVSDKEITEDIIAHLENARDRLEVVWGKMEFERFRLADLPLSQLDDKVTQALREKLGEEKVAAIANSKVDDLSEEDADALAAVLGWRVQNGIYRHILVSVISELWVDYLTKVDALRVSIGLEAFAQRDPLVQYKSKAAEYFKELLSDIRIGVINRMYRYQPRRAGVQATAEQKRVPSQTAAAAQQQPTQSGDGKKKRKRH
jgi:preprotein translocase subunit SecA